MSATKTSLPITKIGADSGIKDIYQRNKKLCSVSNQIRNPFTPCFAKVSAKLLAFRPTC